MLIFSPFLLILFFSINIIPSESLVQLSSKLSLRLHEKNWNDQGGIRKKAIIKRNLFYQIPSTPIAFEYFTTEIEGITFN